MGRVERISPDEWPKALVDTDGSQLIVGGPGTGKTEFLVRRAVHLARTGTRAERILVLTFSRRAAAELRNRIGAALDRSAVPASTFHSLAMRIVETHGVEVGWTGIPTLLTGPEHVELVNELLRLEDPGDWPLPFRLLLPGRAFAEEVSDFVLRAAERGLTPSAIGASGRDDWAPLPGFLHRYRAALLERGRIDYGTLQSEALRVLERDDLGASVAEGFDYVLVDEYQDTTVAQAQMLSAVARPHGNITAAGDPYQSVYSFRGAAVGNMEGFAGLVPDGDLKTIVLEESFRVPAPILEAAARLTAGAELPSAAGPVRPAEGGGSVETYCFDQHTHEAEWIAAEVQRSNIEGRIPLHRMAVLVRSKRRFLPELSRALQRRHIPHETPDARLVDSPIVRSVLDMARAAAGFAPGPPLSRVALGPLFRLGLAAARELDRSLAEGIGGPAAVRRTLPGADALADLLGDPSWATEEPAADGFWRLWSGLPQWAEIVTDADPSARAALASLSQSLERLRERDPAVTLARYAEWSEEEDFEATPLLEFTADEDALTLSTLHQAKGREYDVVFIADAREGILPDLRRRDSLLGIGALGEDDPASYRRFRIQEEMRLAYTAMTRARLRVVWTCSSVGFDDGAGIPSRFLPLVAGTTLEEATRRPQPHPHPVTPFEAEAWLRRALMDPTRPAAVRLAALHHLVAGGDWQPRPAATFAGARRPGPDTGLVPPGAGLSPTQAERYSECPRRYAFERRLGIEGRGSVHARFGSLLHEVLEDVESAAAEEGRNHGAREAAFRALDESWKPGDFGGGAWAMAWRRRAEEALKHLYALWPGEGPAVGIERMVEMDLGGASWRGRVDRIEQREEGLHIVDYKSSKSVPSVADAAGNLQLGFYALAVAEDASMGAGQPVAGAELWYPSSGAGQRKSVAVRRFDMGLLADTREALCQVAAGISAERWEPLPGDGCERCHVRTVCPEWPEGREAFAW